VLVVVAWVVSGYLFPRRSAESLADAAPRPLPQLLATPEIARPLRPSGVQTSLTSLESDERLPADRQASAENVEAESDESGPALQFPATADNSAAAPESTVEEAYPEMMYPTTEEPQFPTTDAPSVAVESYPSTDVPSSATEMPYPVTNTPYGVKLPEKTPLYDHSPMTPNGSAVSSTIRPVEPLKRNPVQYPPQYPPRFPPQAPPTAFMPQPKTQPPVETERILAPAEPEISRIVREPAAPARSEQLESIARQSDQLVRHGFDLAGRGAHFAARAEFIAALRLVAQGLDAEERTTEHGKSLAAAIMALKEAEDFIPQGSMIEANLDIPSLVASHGTPALKEADTAQITSLAALKSYLTYAQGQFAAAAGKEISGSMALRALGKLHDELGQRQNTNIQAAAPKAVVFYQAALLVSPQNYMAANDLGVLLARAGNLRDARAVLEHSAANGYQSTVLHNLATVYRKLGRNDLAAQAGQQEMLAMQAERNRRQASGVFAADGSVQWVAPEMFAQTSPNLNSGRSPAAAPTAQQQAGNAVRQASPAAAKASKPATNAYSGNNPYLKQNNRQPAASAKKPSASDSPFMGQVPKGDVQR
jgi:tetratricopeptide (TPR) repeat protein